MPKQEVPEMKGLLPSSFTFVLLFLVSVLVLGVYVSWIVVAFWLDGTLLGSTR